MAFVCQKFLFVYLFFLIYVHICCHDCWLCCLRNTRFRLRFAAIGLSANSHLPFVFQLNNGLINGTRQRGNVSVMVT